MNITETNVQVLPLKYLRENKGQIEGVPANPRILKDDKYKALVESLREDDMTGAFPLKVYKHNGEYVVLGGNMRLKALRELYDNEYAVSCVLIPADVPAEKLRKMVVLDNSTFGEWDFDMLANEWDADELQDWGVDVPVFEEKPESEEQAQEENVNKSEVIIAGVTLFGQTGETIVCEELKPEDAERLLSLVKEQGANVILQKLLA